MYKYTPASLISWVYFITLIEASACKNLPRILTKHMYSKIFIEYAILSGPVVHSRNARVNEIDIVFDLTELIFCIAALNTNLH